MIRVRDRCVTFGGIGKFRYPELGIGDQMLTVSCEFGSLPERTNCFFEGQRATFELGNDILKTGKRLLKRQLRHFIGG